MKKIIYIICAIFVLINTACEKDFLDVKSQSSVDEDFVFSSTDEAFKALGGCYVFGTMQIILCFMMFKLLGQMQNAILKHIPQNKGTFRKGYMLKNCQ